MYECVDYIVVIQGLLVRTNLVRPFNKERVSLAVVYLSTF